MTKNKTLLLVNNYSLIAKLKEESNITFLFPLKDFTVGFENTFMLSDIDIEGFIFINRILDNASIIKLKGILNNLPKNIKGIVFDDIGVLNVLLELDLKITKILFLNHLNCNYESINGYLKYVDSVVISTDITKEETEEILLKTTKPLVLYLFGHVNIMYSRRNLLTNYNKHFNKNISLNSWLDESMSHKKFHIIENEYGTVIYTSEPFNNLDLANNDNILYNLINTVFLTDTEVINIIKRKDNLEKEYPYKYLSDIKMTVKLRSDENAWIISSCG